MPVFATRAGGKRRQSLLLSFGTMTTALALGTITAAALPSTAQAVERDVVTSITLENQSRSDKDKTIQWDSFKLNFAVNTTGKNVLPGDTFSIEIPETLSTNVTNFPMLATKDKDAVVANCSAPGGSQAGRKLSCTFTDYVATHPNLEGFGWLNSQVNTTKAVSPFVFTVNGKAKIEVPIPGGKVEPPPVPYLPDKALKGGWAVAYKDPTLFYWYIRIKGSGLPNAKTITITDTFGTENGGYRLSDDHDFRPRLYKWDTVKDFENYHTGKPAKHHVIFPGEAVNGGTFTFTKTATGYTASFPNTDPNAIYELRYHTKTNNPKAPAGSSFTNSAELSYNGETITKKIVIATQGKGELNGPGIGSVSVKKKALEGSGAKYVDSKATYRVNASYKLNGQKIDKTLDLSAGGAAQTLASLPQGTVVTLSEVAPTHEDLTWANPKFSTSDAHSSNVKILDGGKKAEVTVKELTTIDVEVTNQVTAPPAPKISIIKKDASGNDADTAADAADLTASKGSVGLDFTVKNTGGEPLVGVEVTDQVTTGKAKVDNLTCVFPDHSKGTKWNGPFAVGASFTCTADLSGVKADDPHGDLAKVKAVGRTTKIPVTDENPYHAKVAPAPTTPPPPVPSTPAPSTPPATPKKPGLPRTGGAAAGLAGAFAALATAGAAFVARRHRQS